MTRLRSGKHSPLRNVLLDEFWYVLTLEAKDQHVKTSYLSMVDFPGNQSLPEWDYHEVIATVPQ